jgi:GGDEF domain-containing protein
MLDLMKKADKAMYTAKEAGRNQFRFYPVESV